MHHRAVVRSTQDTARRLLERGEAGIGHVVLADRQTAGRGRFGRSWLSPRGGFYATYIHALEPLLSLKAAICVGARLRAAGLPVALKWPNDLLIREEKLAGILIETVGEIALVGIGINLASAPLPTATDASCHGVAIEPAGLIRGLADELACSRSEKEILEAYRAGCETLGRRVRIDLGAGRFIEGLAVAVDESGGLLVESGGVIKRVASGTCAHIDGSGGMGRLAGEVSRRSLFWSDA